MWSAPIRWSGADDLPAAREHCLRAARGTAGLTERRFPESRARRLEPAGS
jgi:hypothetical protein